MAEEELWDYQETSLKCKAGLDLEQEMLSQRHWTLKTVHRLSGNSIDDNQVHLSRVGQQSAMTYLLCQLNYSPISLCRTL